MDDASKLLDSSTGIVLFGTNFLVITHKPGLDYLEAKWSRPVSSQEYRYGIESMFSCITRAYSQILLLDYIKKGPPSFSDQKWVADYFKSKLEVTSLRRIASLGSEDVFHQLVIERMEVEFEQLPVQYKGFKSEAFAKDWLLQEEGEYGHNMSHYRAMVG